MARKPDIQYVRFVTDGSAARAAETVRVFAKTRLPKVRKQKQKEAVVYLDPLAFLGIALSCVMLVLMVVSCFQLHSYQIKANQMDAYVDQLKEENARLSDIYKKDIDLQDIKEKAVALGLVPIEEVQRITVAVEYTPAVTEDGMPQWGVLAGAMD